MWRRWRVRRLAQVGKRRHARAVFLPSLHRAVVQARGKCRIRIHIGAVGFEAGGRDFLRRPGDRRLHFIFVLPAYGASLGIDGARQDDHGIARGIDSGFTADPEAFAISGVIHFGFRDEPRRQGVRRLLAH